MRKDTLERFKQRGGGTVYQCQIKQNSRPQSLSWEGLGGQKLGVKAVKVVRISGVMIWSERKRGKKERDGMSLLSL